MEPELQRGDSGLNKDAIIREQRQQVLHLRRQLQEFASHNSRQREPSVESNESLTAPSRELHRVLSSSDIDPQTKVAGERLLLQLSALSQKVGSLTRELAEQKKINENMALSHATDVNVHKDGSQEQAKETVCNILRILSPDESDPSERPLADNLDHIHSHVSLLAAAIRGGPNGNAPSNSLHELLKLAPARTVSAAQETATAPPNDLTLARVIDILGGDASLCGGDLSKLKQQAPQEAIRCRGELEKALRDANAVAIGFKEYARHCQQIGKHLGLLLPSSDEYLQNPLASSFNDAVSNSEWLDSIVSSFESILDVHAVDGDTLRKRFENVLNTTGHVVESQRAAQVRDEGVKQLLSSTLRLDDPPHTLEDVAELVVRQHQTIKRNEVTGVTRDVVSDAAALRSILDEIEMIASDRMLSWSEFSSQFDHHSTRQSSPIFSGPLTLSDVKHALSRLSERINSVVIAAATSNLLAQPSYRGTSNMNESKPQDFYSRHSCSTCDAIAEKLSALIPRTTSSGATSTTTFQCSVAPTSGDIEGMVDLVAERLDHLHDMMQKISKSADHHRNEKIRLEELLQTNGPAIARLLSAALQAIRQANLEDDTDNVDLQTVLQPDGELTDYPLDTRDASSSCATFYDPLIADLEARAKALKTKCIRLGNNHKTDRQRISNYASSQKSQMKRWERTVNAVASLARTIGVDPSPAIQENNPPANGSAVVDVLTRCDEMLRVNNTGVVEKGALETEILDLKSQLVNCAEQRETFSQTISVLLQRLASIGKSVKHLMFRFGPDDDDSDEVIESVLDGTLRSGEDEEDALGAIVKKLSTWSSRIATVSDEHFYSLQRVLKCLFGVHSAVCSDPVELHDANILDIDSTLVRIVDELMMSLGSKDPEGVHIAGSEQDHRLLRIHGVLSHLHCTTTTLLKARYLAIPGMMNEDVDRSSHASPNRNQSIYLDIDPEQSDLSTTELVRLIEQNLRCVDSSLLQFSAAYKQSAIVLQKDTSKLQDDLSSMIGKLSQLDVEDAFGIERSDLRDIYDALKNPTYQNGCHFHRRTEDGGGACPWLLAAGYLRQTYGPLLEILTAKSESQRRYKKLVDCAMDEAAAVVQWLRDEDLGLPPDIATGHDQSEDIELLDEHLPMVIVYCASQLRELNARTPVPAIQELEARLQASESAMKTQRDKLLETVVQLREVNTTLATEKDALASEAAVCRAQLRRLQTQHNDHLEAFYTQPHAQSARASPPRAAVDSSLPLDDGYTQQWLRSLSTPRRDAVDKVSKASAAPTPHRSVKEYVDALCDDILKRQSLPQHQQQQHTQRPTPKATPISRDVSQEVFRQATHTESHTTRRESPLPVKAPTVRRRAHSHDRKAPSTSLHPESARPPSSSRDLLVVKEKEPCVHSIGGAIDAILSAGTDIRTAVKTDVTTKRPAKKQTVPAKELVLRQHNVVHIENSDVLRKVRR